MTDDPFLKKRGIDPEVWAARGCRRYQRGDTWVKEEFRSHLEPNRLGLVSKAVNQCCCYKHAERDGRPCLGTCGGWLMHKHAPPGFPAIPPQLRPDEAIVMDGRTVWHFHGAKTDEKPVFPEEAGKPAGKYLPRARMMFDDAADAHVNKAGDPPKPYDPATGEGYHNGVPMSVVHKHAPTPAKYILFARKRKGPGKWRLKREAARIDLHPLARRLLPEAQVVFFVLEGTPKTDAVISAGGVAFGVPSVTLWDARELKTFASEHLRDKTVLVVPDADWATNPRVERQGLRVRTLLRRINVDAYICAPPPQADCEPGGFYKGVDDFLGVGKGTLGRLVIEGREPQPERIRQAVLRVTHGRQKAHNALEDLSLYSDENGKLTVSFQSLKHLLDIRDSNRVVPLLSKIAHTFEVEHGSLETVIEPTWKEYTQTVWTSPPTLSLNDYYCANVKRQKILVEDFFKDVAFEMVRDDMKEQAATIQVLRGDVEELKRSLNARAA